MSIAATWQAGSGRRVLSDGERKQQQGGVQQPFDDARQDAEGQVSSPLSRRGFVAGALGAGAAAIAVGGEALLVGCAPNENAQQSDTLVSRAAQDKDIPVVEVSPEQVIEGTEFEEASFEDYLELLATYDLPVSSLAHQIDPDLALVLLPGEDGESLRKIAFLDLTSGETSLIVDKPIGTERNVIIYDARASRTLVIWVEVNLGDLSWKTYIAPLLDKALGNAVLAEKGDVDYEPPMLAVYGNKAYWTVMPIATGKARQEDSFLRSMVVRQAVSSGQADPKTVLVSHGRMTTNPLVTDGIITVSPRVDTTNIYHQLTALTCSDDQRVGSLILPQSLRVSDAVFIKGSFCFSIEDNYPYAGGLARFGIYRQLTNGNYLHVSKAPTNTIVCFGDCLLVKSTNSIIGIDPVRERLFIIKPPPRCSDYGEALIGWGVQEKVATCSIRMRQGGKGAEAVMIRVFGRKPQETQGG